MIEWFEELSVGMRFKSEAVLVSAAEIKQFVGKVSAPQFDSDNETSQKTASRGLAASQWHVAMLAMSLVTRMRPLGPHPLFSLAADNPRWMLPVRSGDTLHVEGEVVGLEYSKNRSQGTVLFVWKLFNQDDEAVYGFTPCGSIPCRPNKPTIN